MATNQRQLDGRYVTVTASACAPANPSSGDASAFGQIAGVAVADSDTTADKVVLDTGGVYALSVTGKDGAGNKAIGVGDIVYVDGTEVNVDATNGVRVGYAMAAVASGATTTIDVKIGA